MTKTYYDIEAVTKLLDEKEKDLELAATIGKQLLEKDQQLELKIEYLELELEKTTEMVNQLRYEITLKDNLLKSFIDSEADGLWDEQNELAQKKKLNEINTETLIEYKKKITHLERENESLRNQASCVERETTNLESHESFLLKDCIKLLGDTQVALEETQDKLSAKTTECNTQQEEINNLFSQIFELQTKIKTLSQTNSDIKSNYETSTSELVNEVNDLKQKYNECLKQLSKTHEELDMVRKKAATAQHQHQQQFQQQQQHGGGSVKKHSHKSTNTTGSSQLTSCEFDDSLIAGEVGDATTNAFDASPRLVGRTPANSNSFATELFCSLARDYRAKNLQTQVSQSSEFVRKVKEKLTRQIPGSNNAAGADSNTAGLQSDSEAELFNCSSNNQMVYDASENASNHLIRPIHVLCSSQQQQQQQQYGRGSASRFLYHNQHCPTPDSVLSTGSGSLYSSMLVKSSSAAGGGFMWPVPEKLQIVKPIEGSQTLQHWQQLATPHLACLFDERPGVRVVNESAAAAATTELLVTAKKELSLATDTVDEGVDDCTGFDDFSTEQFEDDDDDSDDQEMDDEVDSYMMRHNLVDVDTTTSMLSAANKRVLSPSKVELLSRLLEREEQQQQHQIQNDEEQQKQSSSVRSTSIFGLIKRYFSSDEDKKTQPIITRSRKECDDPDTPPSSPVNLPTTSSNNILMEVFNSAKNYFGTTTTQNRTAPKRRPSQINRTAAAATAAAAAAATKTPPATPNQEIVSDIDSTKTSSTSSSTLYSFFDQIVSRLSLFGSTTTDTQQQQQQQHQQQQSNKNTSNTVAAKVEFTIDDFHEEEKELVELELEKSGGSSGQCSTPPPSPSKFTPPLPDLLPPRATTSSDEEEQMRKSAFVKVTSLNPYLSQYPNNNRYVSSTSAVDLASLLGTLSSLKRNQHF